jgi:hypothetical protein
MVKRGIGLIIWGAIATVWYIFKIAQGAAAGDVEYSMFYWLVFYIPFGLWPLISGIKRELNYRRSKLS